MNPATLQQIVVVAIAAAVLAPVSAAAILRLGFFRDEPRLPAVGSVTVSLMASVVLLMAWHSAGSVSLDFGDRLAGGSLGLGHITSGNSSFGLLHIGAGFGAQRLVPLGAALRDANTLLR